MEKKIIKLTENDLMNIVKRVVLEQTETINYNKAIQCFLNKKGIKDSSNRPLDVDGSIGTYPKSKATQAIAKYQQMIGINSDGVWGNDTNEKMPKSDKIIFKQCISDYGDILDKGAHWLGLD